MSFVPNRGRRTGSGVPRRDLPHRGCWLNRIEPLFAELLVWSSTHGPCLPPPAAAQIRRSTACRNGHVTNLELRRVSKRASIVKPAPTGRRHWRCAVPPDHGDLPCRRLHPRDALTRLRPTPQQEGRPACQIRNNLRLGPPTVRRVTQGVENRSGRLVNPRMSPEVSVPAPARRISEVRARISSIASRISRRASGAP